MIIGATAERPKIGKTSLFGPQNEVSPSKTDVFPADSDYKSDFSPGKNEVYPLESSCKTRFIRENFA
jgi:hypothetical protein